MDAESKRSFLDRLGILQRKMRGVSEVFDVGGPDYTESLVGALRDTGFGCMVETLGPSRIPSSTRCGDTYVGVCWLELLDMRHGITARFSSRVTGKDRSKVGSDAYRGVFEIAGMAGCGELVGFRCIDMGSSEYSPNLRLLSPDVPYVSI